MNRVGSVFVIAMALLGPGCDVQIVDADPSAARAEAVVGSRTTTAYPVVSLHFREGAIRTGLLVADRLVLVHAVHVLAGSFPRMPDVARFWDLGAGTYDEQAPTHLNFDGDFAILQMARPFKGAPRPWPTVKGVEPEGQQGALNCVAFDPQREGVLYAAWMETSRVSLPTFHVVPGSIAGEHLEEQDLGAPCFDAFGGSVFGVSLGVPDPAYPEESEMLYLGDLHAWIEDMKNLDHARRVARRTLSLFNRASPPSDMCLTEASGMPARQYSCSSSPRQQFHWTRSPSSGGGATYYNLVSAETGQCVEVDGASRASGASIVMRPCHWGPSQRFDLGLHDPQATGLKVVTMPDFGDTLCLAVAGAGGSFATLESRTCTTGVTTNLDERWYLKFH